MHLLQEIKAVDFSNQRTLSIDQFIKMDHRAMKEYFLTVELMMEVVWWLPEGLQGGDTG